MSTPYPQSRTDGILTQTLANELLVYDLHREKVLSLNESTSLVFRECDGTKSIAQISRVLTAEVGATISEDVVWMAVRQLKTEHLLELNDAIETPFDGMTRREMVRRVGLAAAIALPAIFEVAAPSAAHAQSLVCGPVGNCTFGSTTACICLPIALPGSNINPDGCPCSTAGDCSGNCTCQNPCTVGSCPQGAPCVTDVGDSAFGTCAGTCPPGNNVCAGGTLAPICIPGDTSNRNPDCCPCSNVEGCANCCNDGVCGPCIG